MSEFTIDPRAILGFGEEIKADIEKAEEWAHFSNPDVAATMRAAHTLIIELENEVARAKKELAAYKDTGLTPVEVVETVKALGDNETTAARDLATLTSLCSFDRLRELAQADKEGRCVVLTEEMALALSAGALSIENNKRLHGTIYVLDPFGDNKEIPYLRAARILRETAESAMKEGE